MTRPDIVLEIRRRNVKLRIVFFAILFKVRQSKTLSCVSLELKQSYNSRQMTRTQILPVRHPVTHCHPDLRAVGIQGYLFGDSRGGNCFPATRHNHKRSENPPGTCRLSTRAVSYTPSLHTGSRDGHRARGIPVSPSAKWLVNRTHTSPGHVSCRSPSVLRWRSFVEPKLENTPHHRGVKTSSNSLTSLRSFYLYLIWVLV